MGQAETPRPAQKPGQRAAARPDRPGHRGPDYAAGPPEQPELAATGAVTQPSPTAAVTRPDASPTASPSRAANAVVPEGERDPRVTRPTTASTSTSVGQPSDGSLLSGIALPVRGLGYLFNPKRPQRARYGTTQLIGALRSAAADVGSQHPEAPLIVNDISLPEGGPIPQHGSHQNGRDADVLFFVRHAATGHPRRSVGVPIDPTGHGTDYRNLADPRDDVPVVLDRERTWTFVADLIRTSGDGLQRIFVVEHVRSMLLDHARKTGAAAALVSRFADISCQPGTPHDDHMHLRYYCSLHDLKNGCLDKPPTYPFRRKFLAEAGLKPRLAGPVRAKLRKAAAARTTTPEQARRKAGPMHPDVVKFLNYRKSWLKKSTPSRRYCR